MRGKTKSLFSLFAFLLFFVSYFFSFLFSGYCSCDCPIKLQFHLLTGYPRSVGGLQGRWSPGRDAAELRKRARGGNEFKPESLSAALQVHTSVTRRQSGRRLLPAFHILSRLSFFLSPCTRPSSSQRRCHNFSLSHHFLSCPMQGEHSLGI